MNESSEREHPTDVPGYEDNLEALAQRILRMRYDRVGLFYAYCTAELQRQAHGDRKRGRTQLAEMLEDTVLVSEEQQDLLERIWRLCRPYMQDEL